jgi:hypothetical protein
MSVVLLTSLLLGTSVPEAVVQPDGARCPAPAPDALSAPRVRWRTVVDALGSAVCVAEHSPQVRREFEALVQTHGLDDSEAVFAEYVRVRVAFEATRDGGWWGLRWTITNRDPNSKAIWAQWAEHDDSEPLTPGQPTARAECDELSALFAVVARRLGVRKVGLLWPQWNHVVAVWTSPGPDGAPKRVVVPTSQVLLDEAQTLGTQGFDPWKQKTIYTYRSKDVPDTFVLPGPLARFMVREALAGATRSTATAQRMRNARAARGWEG